MKRGTVVRIAVAILLAVAMLAAAVASGLTLGGTTGMLQRSLDMSESLHSLGWFLFALLQALIVASGILPASLTGIAAGALYGAWLGFAIAATGTMAGAAVTLALSRSLARPWVERLAARHARLDHLDRMFAENGARLVAMLRLSPVMPFAATSYALGLSSVSVRDYMAGTTASLPALLGYVVLGHLGMSGAAGGYTSWLQWAILGVGVVATLALTIQFGRIMLRVGLVPRAMSGAVAAIARPGTTSTQHGTPDPGKGSGPA